MAAALFFLLGVIVGCLLGLVAGAAFARADLRAMTQEVTDLRAELQTLRGAAPSGASALAGPSPAPSHAEGR